MPPPLGPPWEPRHGPTVGSYGVAVSYEQGTHAGCRAATNQRSDLEKPEDAGVRNDSSLAVQTLQGYLAHKKQCPPRTLQ